MKIVKHSGKSSRKKKMKNKTENRGKNMGNEREKNFLLGNQQNSCGLYHVWTFYSFAYWLLDYTFFLLPSSSSLVWLLLYVYVCGKLPHFFRSVFVLLETIFGGSFFCSALIILSNLFNPIELKKAKIVIFLCEKTTTEIQQMIARKITKPFTVRVQNKSNDNNEKEKKREKYQSGGEIGIE